MEQFYYSKKLKSISIIYGNRFLALICIIKSENYDRPFLIDFNIDVFR